MGEAEVLVLERSLRFSERDTVLEQGWLLAEIEQRFGYGLDDLAHRFDRSTSWVSRRLAADKRKSILRRSRRNADNLQS